MATTTRVLTASVNGTVYTSNANGALEAIDTCHSGATAPTNEVSNGKFWLDTSTTPGILKMYNNASWEVIGGSTSSPTFGSAEINGNLTVDTSTLHVDSTNNRVGVGTTSPTEKLDVVNGVARFPNNITPAVENDGAAYFGKIGSIAAISGSTGVAFRQSGTELGRINSTGLGIGTSNPSAALDVVGTTELNGNTTVDGFLTVKGSTGSIFLTDSDVSTSSRIWQAGENLYIDNQSAIGGDTYFRTDNGKIRQIVRDNGDISFRNTAGTVDGLHWDADTESLGIGTTSPSAALDVVGNAEINGNIYASATQANIIWKSSNVDHTLAFARDSDGVFGLYDMENVRTWFRHIKNASASSQELNLLEGGGELTIGKTAARTTFKDDGSISFGIAPDTFPANNTSGSGVGISSAGRLSAGAESNSCMSFGRNTTTGTTANFYYNGSAVGNISVTGSATAYNTSSDYRLKENITPVQGAVDIVKAMQPVTYTFKSDGSWHDGFLAHELQVLHPRAVLGEKDAMVDEEYEVTPAVYEDVIIPAVDAVAEVPAVYDDEGALVSEMVPAVEAQPERTEQQLVSEAVMGTRSVPDYQGVDYSKLTPILTAALQEALNKIDALEARVAALEL